MLVDWGPYRSSGGESNAADNDKVEVEGLHCRLTPIFLADEEGERRLATAAKTSVATRSSAKENSMNVGTSSG